MSAFFDIAALVRHMTTAYSSECTARGWDGGLQGEGGEALLVVVTQCPADQDASQLY